MNVMRWPTNEVNAIVMEKVSKSGLFAPRDAVGKYKFRKTQSCHSKNWMQILVGVVQADYRWLEREGLEWCS